MNIAVLGTGPVKRKQVTAVLDTFAEDEAVTLYAGTLDPDVAPDSMRFATDWAEMKGAHVEIVSTDGDCATYADVVLVAWDDNQVAAIEEWVKACKGAVYDLTNDLAQITLEGEPDEAQQPSDQKPVSKPLAVGDVMDNGVILTSIEHGVKDQPQAGRAREEEIELIELGKAVRTLLDYVAYKVQQV